MIIPPFPMFSTRWAMMDPIQTMRIPGTLMCHQIICMIFMRYFCGRTFIILNCLDDIGLWNLTDAEICIVFLFFRWERFWHRATSKIASSALLLVSQNLQVTIECILMCQTGSPISKPYTYSIFNYISPLGSMPGFSSTITLGLIIGLTWCQCLLQYRELAAKANSAAANHHCRPPARLCDTKRNPDHSHISSL